MQANMNVRRMKFGMKNVWMLCKWYFIWTEINILKIKRWQCVGCTNYQDNRVEVRVNTTKITVWQWEWTLPRLQCESENAHYQDYSVAVRMNTTKITVWRWEWRLPYQDYSVEMRLNTTQAPLPDTCQPPNTHRNNATNFNNCLLIILGSQEAGCNQRLFPHGVFLVAL